VFSDTFYARGLLLGFTVVAGFKPADVRFNSIPLECVPFSDNRCHKCRHTTEGDQSEGGQTASIKSNSIEEKRHLATHHIDVNDSGLHDIALVDTTGDGVHDTVLHVGEQKHVNVVVRRISSFGTDNLSTHHHRIELDTTGDGLPDVALVDTTGDGVHDKVLHLHELDPHIEHDYLFDGEDDAEV
jgi:hypothetical protein